MRSLNTLLLVTVAIAAIGCGGNDTTTNTNSNVNANSASNSTATGNTNALDTVKAPEAATANDAPTLGPVINAYYDALRKKDAAGVRKVMERKFLSTIEEDMKAEGKTDIVAFLTETDKLPSGKMEARNEKITGNKGIAEVKGGSYVTWTPTTFVKEDGVWKVSNEVPSPGAR